ncbi:MULTISPECIES: adenylosuccinate synthetase [Mesorhizobium]|uniref:adenylosuccinate synthetase n=1 Tax=Mesorhizobium sp. TaxID=1871066 RepID=UPI0004949D5F|nr:MULTISPECIES: adenylosuccinate synthetase [Mesorhizobium]RWM71593.1 MAG: hypothetical protein EOR82_17355 [Mesorhizobium sp.]TIO24760.1 MAG: hypothetical protein E5X83_15985 [Mesorhizobium sp.]TJV56061.1 MAG: hypothetical protein E5X82_25135 [Mesorhizobium sp.]
MPISIVVGGQFGSEGKGKVALEIVRRNAGPVTVVRVGGPNSGHTAYDMNGKKWALRQMPAACVDKNVDVVFPEGSFLEPSLLMSEIRALDYPMDRVFISEHAKIILPAHKKWEQDAELVASIGSTGSGVGGAVMALAARHARNFPLPSAEAGNNGILHGLTHDTSSILEKALSRQDRVVIEGTQGFGLSLLEGAYWPKVTSRITTASGALSEAGLSPRDVDDITMVIRSFPIRVAGDSGPLVGETTWSDIARITNREDTLAEYTTVTQKIRRVGVFDSIQVSRALRANNPHRLVLNHLDYLGSEDQLHQTGSGVRSFVLKIQREIGRKVNWFGFSPIGVTEGKAADELTD